MLRREAAFSSLLLIVLKVHVVQNRVNIYLIAQAKIKVGMTRRALLLLKSRDRLCGQIAFRALLTH